MNPKKIWANLAVSNLDRTTEFYTAIGCKPNGASAELTSFIIGENGFVINFFLEEQLQTAMKGELADLQSGNEIIFTLGAASRSEVDNWALDVTNAGGKIISPPEEFGKGYYGFIFTDPDGHKFNVFFMEDM